MGWPSSSTPSCFALAPGLAIRLRRSSELHGFMPLMPRRPIVHPPPPLPLAAGSSHEVGAPPRLLYMALRCALMSPAGPPPPETAPPSAPAATDATVAVVAITAAAACTVVADCRRSWLTAAEPGLETLTKFRTSRPLSSVLNGGCAGGWGGGGVGGGGDGAGSIIRASSAMTVGEQRAKPSLWPLMIGAIAMGPAELLNSRRAK